MQATIFGRVVSIEDVKVLETTSVLKLVVSVPLARGRKAEEQYAPSELVTIEVWGNLIPAILDNFEPGSRIACTAKYKGTEAFVSGKTGKPACRATWSMDQIHWPTSAAA